MDFTKKKLLSLIKENLNEMAMDFDPNSSERPHQNIQSKLQVGNTPIKKIPLPKTGREEGAPGQNFQELVASDRYKQVINKLRGFGINAPVRQISNINDYASDPIVGLMGNAHTAIQQIESQHRVPLAQLAIELVTKAWQIPEGYCQWDVQIVGGNTAGDIENYKQDQPGEENLAVVDDAQEVINNLEQLNLERAKRRFINLIIQGASKRGHYMYQIFDEELRSVIGDQADDLIYQYGVLMSTNDTMYWQMSDDLFEMGKSGIGGEEDVDPNTDPPTIKVRAVNFPICVHECIKGWLELVGTKGEPENLQDREVYQQAMEMEDTLDKERWDLLLGPVIWDRINEMIPEELYTNRYTHGFQNFLLMEIFKLPAKKMLTLLREVVAQSEIGKRLISELIAAIKENMENYEREVANYEYNESLDRFNDDLDELTSQTDGEDLSDFMRQFGIKLSSEEEDELRNDDEDEEE